MIPLMDQPSPALSWTLALAGATLVGIAKSGFGSGVGIVAIPLFVYAFDDPRQAVGALLPILIVADVFSVWAHWGKWDTQNLRVLWPGTVAGLVLGTVLLYLLLGMPRLWWWPGASVSAPAPAGMLEEATAGLKTAIGIVCLVYVVADRIKAQWAPTFAFKADGLTGTVAGVSVGVATTLAHAAGPFATIYLLGQRLGKDKFIGTAVIYFFVVNVVKLLPYTLLGMIDSQTLWPGLWLMPMIPLGVWLGLMLNRWISDALFGMAILVIVALSGLQLVTGVNPLCRLWSVTGL